MRSFRCFCSLDIRFSGCVDIRLFSRINARLMRDFPLRLAKMDGARRYQLNGKRLVTKVDFPQYG